MPYEGGAEQTTFLETMFLNKLGSYSIARQDSRLELLTKYRDHLLGKDRIWKRDQWGLIDQRQILKHVNLLIEREGRKGVK